MQCSQDVLKHVEETEHSTESESQQLESIDPVASSAQETVSALHSNRGHAAVDPKYVQLLGDKAAVSVNLVMFSLALIFASAVRIFEISN